MQGKKSKKNKDQIWHLRMGSAQNPLAELASEAESWFTLVARNSQDVARATLGELRP